MSFYQVWPNTSTEGRRRSPDDEAPIPMYSDQEPEWFLWRREPVTLRFLELSLAPPPPSSAHLSKATDGM